MMLPLLLFCLLLAASLTSLLLRRPQRRREKARSMLCEDAASTRGFLRNLRGVQEMRGHRPTARMRFILPPILIGCLVFAFSRSLLFASLAWPATLLAKRLLQRYRGNKARLNKEEQVLEFIDSLSQSLRAGLSLRQALEVSLEDVGDELGGDVLEVLRDIRMGSGLQESLLGAAEASSSASLRLTFTVLGLLHGRGGDLPRILERLRKRVAGGLEVRREARILTSQSRASGYLVSSLPAVFLFLQAALNPRSLRPLFATPTGNLIIAAAVALNAAAFVLIHKLVDQEV